MKRYQGIKNFINFVFLFSVSMISLWGISSNYFGGNNSLENVYFFSNPTLEKDSLIPLEDPSILCNNALKTTLEAFFYQRIGSKSVPILIDKNFIQSLSKKYKYCVGDDRRKSNIYSSFMVTKKLSENSSHYLLTDIKIKGLDSFLLREGFIGTKNSVYSKQVVDFIFLGKKYKVKNHSKKRTSINGRDIVKGRFYLMKFNENNPIKIEYEYADGLVFYNLEDVARITGVEDVNFNGIMALISLLHMNSVFPNIQDNDMLSNLRTNAGIISKAILAGVDDLSSVVDNGFSVPARERIGTIDYARFIRGNISNSELNSRRSLPVDRNIDIGVLAACQNALGAVIEVNFYRNGTSRFLNTSEMYGNDFSRALISYDGQKEGSIYQRYDRCINSGSVGVSRTGRASKRITTGTRHLYSLLSGTDPWAENYTISLDSPRGYSNFSRTELLTIKEGNDFDIKAEFLFLGERYLSSLNSKKIKGTQMKGSFTIGKRMENDVIKQVKLNFLIEPLLRKLTIYNVVFLKKLTDIDDTNFNGSLAFLSLIYANTSYLGGEEDSILYKRLVQNAELTYLTSFFGKKSLLVGEKIGSVVKKLGYLSRGESSSSHHIHRRDVSEAEIRAKRISSSEVIPEVKESLSDSRTHILNKFSFMVAKNLHDFSFSDNRFLKTIISSSEDYQNIITTEEIGDVIFINEFIDNVGLGTNYMQANKELSFYGFFSFQKDFLLGTKITSMNSLDNEKKRALVGNLIFQVDKDVFFSFLYTLYCHSYECLTKNSVKHGFSLKLGYKVPPLFKNDTFNEQLNIHPFIGGVFVLDNFKKMFNFLLGGSLRYSTCQKDNLCFVLNNSNFIRIPSHRVNADASYFFISSVLSMDFLSPKYEQLELGFFFTIVDLKEMFSIRNYDFGVRLSIRL